jgi:hypothetical protein
MEMSVMVAAPATAIDLTKCRRDVVGFIVVILNGKVSERIATGFDGSTRKDQYTSAKSLYQNEDCKL